MDTRVIIDGIVIGRAVTGFSVKAGAGKLLVLQLDLLSDHESIARLTRAFADANAEKNNPPPESDSENDEATPTSG